MKSVHLPGSLAELWPLLEREAPGSVYCGGTDLLVQMRSGAVDPSALICLERIADLQGVQEENDCLRIGAGTTHNNILNHPLVGRRLPILFKALETLGSPLIRNMGTIGGNICTASPAGDLLPPLYLLDAEVTLRSGKGSRTMPLQTFIIGPGRTQLAGGEILADVRVKMTEGYNVQHFEKVGQRRAMACAIASMAALLQISSTGRIEAARLAWGSVGPTVVTSGEVEKALIGEKLSRRMLEGAAGLVRQAVSPIDDIRASSAYRREISGNLLLRLAAPPSVF